ncbi:hypothetical protein C7E12_20935, partial [Stenotrophomonas maltophilia]
VSGYAQGGYTWDDNTAHFTLDALDANGIPVRRMSYLTYGYYHGTDLRTDVNQWWMVSGYAQGGYTWDDNTAHFTLDALDANGIPVRR